MITEVPISEIMTKDPISLTEDASVEDAVQEISKNSIASLLVVKKNGELVGLVSEGDIIKRVYAKKKDPRKVILKEIMITDLKTITPETSIGETAKLMQKYDVSKFPVVERKRLVGYVTKSDLVEELNEIYYENARLKWLPVVMTIMLIVIAILIVVYINKGRL